MDVTGGELGDVGFAGLRDIRHLDGLFRFKMVQIVCLVNGHDVGAEEVVHLSTGVGSVLEKIPVGADVAVLGTGIDLDGHDAAVDCLEL